MRGDQSVLTRMFDLGAQVARFLPTSIVTATGDCLALAAWVGDARRREAVESNLRRLAPNLSASARRRLGRRTFRLKARATIEGWRLTPHSVATLLTTVDVEGRGQLSAAIAEGRGVIVVAPHLGPWDVGAAWFAAAGHRPCAVVEHLPDGAFETHSQMRHSLGIDVVPHDQPARLRQTLREGRVLILMADRVFGTSSLDVPFANGVRAVPLGPAVLARLTGAPVVGAWIAFDPSGRRLIGGLERFDAPAKDDIEALTRAIGAWCGRTAARFPDQWFVFQPGWRTEGEPLGRDEASPL